MRHLEHGDYLEESEGHLGVSVRQFGGILRHLESFRGYLEAFWGYLKAFTGHLEANRGHLVEKSDVFEKIVGELRFYNQYIENFLLVILI